MSDEKDKKDPWPWDDDWTPKLEKLVYRLISRKRAHTAFGVWNDRDTDGGADAVSNNTIYQAATDGFVCAYSAQQAGIMQGLTDSSNPPTTVRAQSNNSGTEAYFIMMPVRKGDYWKTLVADTVYWMPIGT